MTIDRIFLWVSQHAQDRGSASMDPALMYLVFLITTGRIKELAYDEAVAATHSSIRILTLERSLLQLVVGGDRKLGY